MLEETDVFEPPPPAPPKRRRGRRVALLVILLVAVILAGGAGYVVWASGGSSNGKPVRVIIPEGANGAEIASLLQRNHVIRSAFMFSLIARVRGVSTGFKPGAYDLRTGLGVSAAIDALRKGVPLKVYRFT